MTIAKNRLGILLAALVTVGFTLTTSAQSAPSPAVVPSSASTGFLPPAIRKQLFPGVQQLPVKPVQAPSLPGLEPSIEDQIQANQQGLVVDPNAPVQTSATVLSLLDYMRAHVTHDTIDDLDKANQGYNRRDNFGGWIVADSSQGCLDTRGVVLVRAEDSTIPITYKDSRNCLVVKGLWHDPYAGTDYKLAKAVQIDHVVPLKHVYLTGGKDWAPERRCYYANFIHNDFHLLAVSGHENMSKSDKAPDQYLPPNESFQCQYVSSWMKVKAIWGLIATDAELATIEQVIQEHHCDDSKLQITQAALQAEQDAITNSVPQRCADFGSVMAPSAAPALVAPPVPPVPAAL